MYNKTFYIVPHGIDKFKIACCANHQNFNASTRRDCVVILPGESGTNFFDIIPEDEWAETAIEKKVDRYARNGYQIERTFSGKIVARDYLNRLYTKWMAEKDREAKADWHARANPPERFIP